MEEAEIVGLQDINGSDPNLSEKNKQFVSAADTGTQRSSQLYYLPESEDSHIISRNNQNPINRAELSKKIARARIRLRACIAFRSLFKDIQNLGAPLYDKYLKSQNYKNILKNIKFLKMTEITHKPIINSKFIFPGDTWLAQNWILLMFLMYLYVLIGMPVTLAFQDINVGDKLWIWEVVINILFTIDILIISNLAHKDAKNEIITHNRYEIFKRNLKNFLILDILAVIPTYVVIMKEGRQYSYVKLFWLLKITVISRVNKYRISKSSRTFHQLMKTFQTHQAKIRLILGIIIVSILVHIFACLWCWTAKLNYFESETWVTRYEYNDYSNGRLYLRAFYFGLVVLSTVGFGDISPLTVGETILVILWILFGIAFYSFFLGTVSSILSSYDQRMSELADRMMKIEEFSKECGLSDDLTKSLQATVRKPKGGVNIDEETRRELISIFTIKNRYDIAMEMNRNAALKIPFLSEQSVTFISDVVPRLCVKDLEMETFVYKLNYLPEELYFLVNGRANYVFGHENIVYKTLSQGSYFGEIELINKTKRQHSIMTEINCTFLVMSRDLLNYVLVSYPQTAKIMIKNSRKKLKNINKAKNVIMVIHKLAENRNITQEISDTSSDVSSTIHTIIKQQTRDLKRTQNTRLDILSEESVDNIRLKHKISKIIKDIKKVKSLLRNK